jgi:hypothetical protein
MKYIKLLTVLTVVLWDFCLTVWTVGTCIAHGSTSFALSVCPFLFLSCWKFFRGHELYLVLVSLYTTGSHCVAGYVLSRLYHRIFFKIMPRKTLTWRYILISPGKVTLCDLIPFPYLVTPHPHLPGYECSHKGYILTCLSVRTDGQMGPIKPLDWEPCLQ